MSMPVGRPATENVPEMVLVAPSMTETEVPPPLVTYAVFVAWLTAMYRGPRKPWMTAVRVFVPPSMTDTVVPLLVVPLCGT
jgi:hypothetical protein